MDTTFGWQEIFWIISNVIVLVIGYFKFQMSYTKFKTETEIKLAEIQGDIEDHKLAYEKRFADHENENDKRYDDFHDQNSDEHHTLLQKVDRLIQDVSYIKGTLDQHLKTHSTVARKNR